MHLSTLLSIISLFLLTSASTPTSTLPGYFTNFTTITKPFSFGKHYAVLNLDLITGLIAGVENTTSGNQFINSTATWINAVHAQNPPPLSIFTRIYFQSSLRPEIKPGSLFAQAVAALGNVTEDDAVTQVYDAFKVEGKDVVLQKARYYAGAGNELELILASQGIKTVVLSGLRTSGVILRTAYSLMELNYNVYVIVDNVIETPPNGLSVDRTIKSEILPKLPVHVITLEQALQALDKSGPAVY